MDRKREFLLGRGKRTGLEPDRGVREIVSEIKKENAEKEALED